MSPEWVGVAGGDQKKFAGAGQIMGKAERPLINTCTAKIFYFLFNFMCTCHLD